MKKLNVFTGLFLAFLFSFIVVRAEEKKVPANADYKMPAKVKTVIDNKCFGCHNTDSRNEDAKKELDFKTLDGLSKVKKVGAFNHITKVLEEGTMPPKKLIERKPEQALTEKEMKILTNWVEKGISSLIKE
ncbi:heme-binding domain-containing protein [Sunxiuqinia sp. A32]|uniref:heme-binding domain-containing protein n=1 Tax=Sunxiuqinia sp. A32 TaxID=3461496 RepID=UPI004045596B